MKRGKRAPAQRAYEAAVLPKEPLDQLTLELRFK